MINPIMSELVEIVLEQAEDKREGYNFLNDLLEEILKNNRAAYELSVAIEDEARRTDVCCGCGSDEIESVKEIFYDLETHHEVETLVYRKCMNCGLELDY